MSDDDHNDYENGGAGGGDGGVDGQPGEGELAALAEDLRRAERLWAQAVVRAGRLASSGEAEREAGQSLQLWLGVACRLTGADRATLVTAGEVLADMSVLRGLFLDGDVSWGQVRAITRLVRRRSRADRAWLDERIGATFTHHEGEIGNVEPDELVGAAERAVDELCDLARRERDEADGVAASFVAVQPSFDGGARVYGELDALTTATVVGTLDRAAEKPQRDDTGQPATTAASGWSTTARSRQYAAALARVCGDWAASHRSDAACGSGDHDPERDDAGDDGAAAGGSRPVTGRAPKPIIRVGVTLAEATAATAGTVDVPVRGMLPRLTAAAVEALACDATVQAVVFDGARPLETTAKLHADDIPAAIRAAVELRDRGCRWPGCDAPLAQCEIHHLVPQAMGGTHHPENLACLCRVDHLRAHGHHWQLELDGDSGALAGYQGRARKWTTQPRATPLTQPRHPPNGGDGGGDRDPPTDGDADRNPLGWPPPDDPPPGWGRIVDDDGNPLPF